MTTSRPHGAGDAQANNRATARRLITRVLLSFGFLVLSVVASSACLWWLTTSRTRERLYFAVDLTPDEIIGLSSVLHELEPRLGMEIVLRYVPTDTQYFRLQQGASSWDLVAFDVDALDKFMRLQRSGGQEPLMKNLLDVGSKAARDTVSRDALDVKVRAPSAPTSTPLWIESLAVANRRTWAQRPGTPIRRELPPAAAVLHDAAAELILRAWNCKVRAGNNLSAACDLTSNRLLFMPLRLNTRISLYEKAAFEYQNGTPVRLNDLSPINPPMSLDALAEMGRRLATRRFESRSRAAQDHERSGPTQNEWSCVIVQGFPGKAAAVTVLEAFQGDEDVHGCVLVNRRAGGPPIVFACTQCGGRSCQHTRKARDVVASLVRVLCVTHGDALSASFDTSIDYFLSRKVDLVDNWTYSYKRIVENTIGSAPGTPHDGVGVYAGWQRRHVIGGDFLAVPQPPAPEVTNDKPGWFGQVLARINASLKGPDKARKAVHLAALLLEKETQKKLAERLRWVPIRTDAFDALPDPLRTAVNEAMEDPIVRPYVDWDENERKLSELMSTISRLVAERLAWLRTVAPAKPDTRPGTIAGAIPAPVYPFADRAVFECFVDCIMSELAGEPGD